MNIIKNTNIANTTKCNREPTYLCYHYTAGTKSAKGQAMAIARYFGRTKTKASADFIVDDETIVQYNENPTKRYCWAVGGKEYNSTTTSIGGQFYNIAKNENCISVEMCSQKVNTKSLKASDTDWYLTDAVINNAVELGKYLMELYNIPIENVIMHHQVTGKVCPNPWCVDESRLNKWNDFKSRLTTTSNPLIHDGLDYSLVFDLEYYCNTHQDVSKALGTSLAPVFNHFITYGMKEGRQATKNFNVQVYKNIYKDLRDAFGDDLPKYYKHYITNGHKEGRLTI